MTRPEEAAEIVHALRAGLVPRRGLPHLATGLDRLLGAIDQELDFVAGGHGAAKWIRGEYGSGKTFATRFICARARERKFATAEIQISINDTPLHHLEMVYRRLVERLETASDGPGAFQAVVDAWLYQVGDEVQRLRGLTEDDPGFADATEQRLEDKLADLSRKNASFAAVLRAYHRAMHRGELQAAQGLLAWLAGQPNTSHAILAKAGVRGKVDGAAALLFLGGLLRLLRQSGYAGLVVVLDEVETIQRMNAQTREKALNALRQLMDMLADEELPGLYLLVTGTRDFFEGYKGLKSAAALYQRVHVAFGDDPQWDNQRAPQVRLLSFTPDRLLEVGRKLRAIFPAQHPERVATRVSDAFLQALVTHVTEGFGGQVAVAPRIFLRELTDVLDRVDQHPDFDPAAHYKLNIDEGQLLAEELAARRGAAGISTDDEGEPSASRASRPRRLDG